MKCVVCNELIQPLSVIHLQDISINNRSDKEIIEDRAIELIKMGRYKDKEEHV